MCKVEPGLVYRLIKSANEEQNHGSTFPFFHKDQWNEAELRRLGTEQVWAEISIFRQEMKVVKSLVETHVHRDSHVQKFKMLLSSAFLQMVKGFQHLGISQYRFINWPVELQVSLRIAVHWKNVFGPWDTTSGQAIISDLQHYENTMSNRYYIIFIHLLRKTKKRLQK